MSTISPLRLPQSTPTPGTRRRSFWGCLLTGTTGCAAFLVGALVAGLLLSPRIFAPFLARDLASNLDACLTGKLSIEGAQIAWAKPVHLRGVRLQDAGGAEVLAAEVVLPGMLELLGEPGTPTVVHANLTPTRLAFDRDGGCALLDALALVLEQGGERLEPLQANGRFDPLLALRRLGLRALGGALRLELTCDDLVWSDARAGAEEQHFSGVSLALTSEPDGRSGRIEVTMRGSFAGAGEENEVAPTSTLTFSVDDYFAPGWNSIELHASLHRASTAWLDALLGAQGWLASMAGDRVDLEMHLEGDPRVGAAAQGSVSSEGVSASWKGNWRNGVLLVPAGSVEGALAGMPRALADRLADLLALAPAPGGALATEVDQPAAPWPLLDSGFELDSAIGMPRMPSVERPLTWTCKLAANAPCTLALRSPEQRLVELAASRWSLERSARGFALGLDCTLRDPTGTSDPGSLTLTLPGYEASAEPPAIVTAEAKKVPACAIDALLGRGAWIGAALGPLVDAHLEIAGAGAERASLDVELSSESGRSRFRGWIGESFLASELEDGLEAELALSPAVESRILAPLFPWLADFRAPSPADRLALRMGSFHLPLDDELVGLQGRVQLAAPAWSYRFFDQLERLVATEGEPLRFEGLGPSVLGIEHGEIAYDGLALVPGAGTAEGNVSLVDEKIELELGVPLGAAAPVDGEESLANEAAISLELHGTLDAPRLGMGFQELGSFLFKGLEGSNLLEKVRRGMSALGRDN